MKNILSLVLIITAIVIMPIEALAAAPTGNAMFAAILQTDMYDSAGNNYCGKIGTWFDAGNGKYAFIITKNDGDKIYCSDRYYQISGTKYWFSDGYTTTNPKNPNASPQVNPGPGYQQVGPGYGPSNPVSPTQPAEGYWEGHSGSWKYVLPNGHYARNRSIEWNGNEYRFDAEGYMVTGLYGHYLYSFGDDGRPEGALIRHGWIEINGNWYYATSDGTVTKNSTINWGDHRYHLDENGHMSTGLTRIGEDLYFFNDGRFNMPYGAMIKSKLVRTDRYQYYFGSNGQAYRNSTKVIDGIEYRFDNNGHRYW